MPTMNKDSRHLSNAFRILFLLYSFLIRFQQQSGKASSVGSEFRIFSFILSINSRFQLVAHVISTLAGAKTYQQPSITYCPIIMRLPQWREPVDANRANVSSTTLWPPMMTPISLDQQALSRLVGHQDRLIAYLLLVFTMENIEKNKKNRWVKSEMSF